MVQRKEVTKCRIHVILTDGKFWHNDTEKHMQKPTVFNFIFSSYFYN